MGFTSEAASLPSARTRTMGGGRNRNRLAQATPYLSRCFTGGKFIGRVSRGIVPVVDPEKNRQLPIGPMNGERHTMQIEPGSPVTVEDDRTGYQYPASMRKCGNGELYLESNYAPRPGSKLHILSETRERCAGPCARPAVIQWRKLLCHLGSSWSYSLGIKYA